MQVTAAARPHGGPQALQGHKQAKCKHLRSCKQNIYVHTMSTQSQVTLWSTPDTLHTILYTEMCATFCYNFVHLQKTTSPGSGLWNLIRIYTAKCFENHSTTYNLVHFETYDICTLCHRQNEHDHVIDLFGSIPVTS